MYNVPEIYDGIDDGDDLRCIRVYTLDVDSVATGDCTWNCLQNCLQLFHARKCVHNFDMDYCAIIMSNKLTFRYSLYELQSKYNNIDKVIQ